MLSALFKRHGPGKVVLQLSAGKDSAACLWLAKPWWDKLIVAWCNPGNPTPATVKYMDKIAKQVPYFHIVLGQQREWVKEKGYPTDILPVEGTPLGRMANMPAAVNLSFIGDCCSANLWQPMADFVKQGGFTAVIRGQKLADTLRTDVGSGQVIDGVEYCFPLANWTDADVFSYLGKTRLPPGYSEGLEASIDCANCTAYSQHRKGVQAYLDKHMPHVGTEVRMVRREIAKLAAHHLMLLKEE